MLLRELELLILKLDLTIQDRGLSLRGVQIKNAGSANINVRRTVVGPSSGLNHTTHKFQEALGCGIVVSPFIGQILLAHFIHTGVHKGHETADGWAKVRLRIGETIMKCSAYWKIHTYTGSNCPIPTRLILGLQLYRIVQYYRCFR